MKKHLLPLLLLLALPAAAQPAGLHLPHRARTPEERQQPALRPLARHLHLAGAQRTRVEDLLLAEGRALRDLRVHYRPSEMEEGRAADIGAVRADYESQLQQVLGAGPYAALLDLRASGRDQPWRGGH